jgi:hypothetical protein
MGNVTGGAFALTKDGPAPVFGVAIQITPLEHSVKEAAMVTNLNFHAPAAPAVLTHEDLPGPVDDMSKVV